MSIAQIPPFPHVLSVPACEEGVVSMHLQLSSGPWGCLDDCLCMHLSYHMERLSRQHLDKGARGRGSASSAGSHAQAGGEDKGAGRDG